MNEKNNKLIELQKQIEKIDKIYNKENFDGITKFLEEFSSKLKTSKIENKYIKTDLVSSLSMQYTIEYFNNISKIIKNDSAKKIEWFNLYNKEIIKNIKFYNNFLQKNSNLCGSISANEIFVLNNLNLKDSSSLISTHTKYAFKNDSNITIEDAYNKSIINEIKTLGESIIDKLEQLDLLSIGGEKILDITSERGRLGLIITRIIVDDNGLKTLIDILYKTIYEASGENSRIIEILGNKGKEIIMLIKRIRGAYEHSPKYAKDKIKEFQEYNTKVIEKKIPTKAIDYKKIQKDLYIRINEMLDLLIEYLNK